MDEEGVRLRAACDRCHAQKLRCLKSAGAGTCDRCSRARTSCVFSPFRQKKETPNDHERGKASVKARLSLLEDRIDSVTEQNRTAVVAKRKRTSSLERHNTGPLTFAAEDLPLTMDNLLSNTGTIEADWSTTSFPLFNDSWPDPTFEDLDFGHGNSSLSISGSPFAPSEDFESHSQRKKGSFRFPSPNIRIDEAITVHAQPDPDPPYIPPRLPPAEKGFTDASGAWDDINTVHPNSEKHLIHQSKLSINLYDHLGTIPDQSIHDFSREDDLPTTMRTFYSGYSLDQTFQLTQDLVDIYPVFINTFLRKASFEASSPPTEPPKIANSQGTATPEDLIHLNASHHIENTNDSTTPHDHSSILLLLSCHLRLIDVFDELFKHMRVCEDNLSRKPTSQPMMYLPLKVQIGRYTPPPSAAIPMQFMLWVQLSSQLAENASELASHLRGPTLSERQYDNALDEEVSDRNDEASRLSLAAAEKVKSRANNMSQQLNEVRIQMLRHGFLA